MHLPTASMSGRSCRRPSPSQQLPRCVRRSATSRPPARTEEQLAKDPEAPCDESVPGHATSPAYKTARTLPQLHRAEQPAGGALPIRGREEDAPAPVALACRSDRWFPARCACRRTANDLIEAGGGSDRSAVLALGERQKPSRRRRPLLLPESHERKLELQRSSFSEPANPHAAVRSRRDAAAPSREPL
jgi:hypothetical protein